MERATCKLQPMEAYKLTCMRFLLTQAGDTVSMRELSVYATTMVDPVSRCYEDLNFKGEEFAKMILLDGIFLIQLFVYKSVSRVSSWKESDIMHDMLLLENQLPFFFVAGLFSILDPREAEDFCQFEYTFLEFAFEYFKDVGIIRRLKLSPSPQISQTWHLVHFLAMLHDHVPLSEEPWESSSKGRLEYNRSASELETAGVSFYHNMGRLFEVSFDKKAGRLKIPQLTVNDTTETFFRNLIALEQCGNDVKFITSYIIFMDSLINTAEDVELLVKHKIINNVLGENQLVADLFNNLYKEVIEDQRKFCFADICEDLDEYNKDCFHQWRSSWFKWKLMLKTNYFSNPWSVVSFIVALIVIILTVVQTVCSILGL